MGYVTGEIDTSEIIDSRDVIDRLTYLENLGEERDDDEEQEYLSLVALSGDCEGYADWPYGVQLIRDDYFTDYMEEFVRDCYTVPEGWPFSHIDWEGVASEARHDYTEVTYATVTYLIHY